MSLATMDIVVFSFIALLALISLWVAALRRKRRRDLKAMQKKVLDMLERIGL